MKRRILRNWQVDPSGISQPSRHPLDFHRSLAGYEPTRLVETPSVAAALGVGRVWVKDESRRFDLPSFKILGASWGIYGTLCARLGLPQGRVMPLSTLRRQIAEQGPLTLVAATDGNHGRAVARMARLLGIHAHILVPDDMAAARIGSIRGEGARVTVVAGTYDDAVVRSAAEADDSNLMISDTSWPGYERVPAWVIEGYSTIGWEIRDRLLDLGAPMPDVIAVQIGVGAFAAAIARQFGAVSRLIGVEPVDAACALASVEAGAIIDVPGPHRSIMAGLNCGRVSLIAWPVISRTIQTFVAVDDADAIEAMRLLRGAGIVSGESGAAGLAGLLAFADELTLAPTSSVLVISTEGATDQQAYDRIVNEPSEKGQTSASR